jgi:TrmH family RNA methyltransferase
MSSNLVSQVRNLQQRKGRKRTGLTLAEGVRLVEDALESGVPLRGVVVTSTLAASERGSALLQDLASRAVAVEEVSERLLGDLADTETPQGVIAVVEQPRFELEDIRVAHGAPVLVVDGVQDPGNVGVLLRTAFALGGSGVILLPGSGDVSNPKVLRASMGASFRIPSVQLSVDELARWLTKYDVGLWIADMEGAPVGRTDIRHPVAVAVGNEGAGVSQPVRNLGGRRVSVPLACGAESLNVAVAAGILLHEVIRG